MAETDILNPQTGFWAAINDNPNPSYGYTRRSAANSTLAKTRLGAPYSRETMNQGFAFEFNFIDRPWTTMLRLKHFYEQFKGGYFTYIDYDAGSRNHVGRFTTPVNPQETSNGKWTAQGLIFEEMPQARMLTYPADFVNWSRTIYVVDDFLNPTVATYTGRALSSVYHGWNFNTPPPNTAPVVPSNFEVLNPTPISGDFAQVEYVGWGFTMPLRIGTDLGQAAIYVDGVNCGTIDLSTGDAVGALTGGLTLSSSGAIACTQMPLDKHRVKIVALAIPGASSAYGTAYGAAFQPLTVIV